MTDTATPRPWSSDFYVDEANDNSWKAQILANKNRPAIAYTWGSDRKEVEANAALIVRAVNAHKELLQIVKDLRYRSFDPSFKGWDFDKLDQAIAKAEALK